jgi:cytochrome c oxidase assembly factor CtaG
VIPLLLVAITAALYARGWRRQRRIAAPARRRALGRRAVAFAAALATLVLALHGPIDDEADRLFWVHMVQHVLLVMVVAPLVVLAAPWMPLWRGLPLGARRWLATGWLYAPGRGALHRLAAPAAAWVLFNGDLVAWHVPALYDLTLRSPAVHDFEHLSFLLLAVLFWTHAVDSPPLRARLDQPRRVAYVLGAATVCWALAVVLAFAPQPLYAGYPSLADQQLAAGVMWGPGSIPYAVFVFAAVYRWLAPEALSARPS